MTTTDEPEVVSLLEPLHRPDPGALADLHRRLESSAQAHGVLDVAYRTIATPVGDLLLAATEQGLVRVAYARQDHGLVLESLANQVSPRVLHAPRRLDATARQVDEYFGSGRRQFDLTLDLRLSKGFRRDVLAHLAQIAYGRTESYAQVALATASPRAVRAVGSACATNPLPLVVPCHRVVRSDGSPGGYAGGPEAKQTLLALEAAD